MHHVHGCHLNVRTVCHRCFTHPNNVALREVFLTTGHLAVVMEYVQGANMPPFLSKHAPLPEDEARSANPTVQPHVCVTFAGSVAHCNHADSIRQP